MADQSGKVILHQFLGPGAQSDVDAAGVGRIPFPDQKSRASHVLRPADSCAVRDACGYGEAGNLHALALGFGRVEIEQNVPGGFGKHLGTEHFFPQAAGLQPPVRYPKPRGVNLILICGAC